MAESRIEVGGIIKVRDLCLIGVMAAPDRPGIGAGIFAALGEAKLNTQFIIQCIDLAGMSNILFCVLEEDALQARTLVQPVAASLGAHAVLETHPVALLSVFGPDFRERSGIAGTVFGAMAQHHINILAISTSISTVTCVIDDEALEQALVALREVVRLP